MYKIWQMVRTISAHGSAPECAGIALASNGVGVVVENTSARGDGGRPSPLLEVEAAWSAVGRIERSTVSEAVPGSKCFTLLFVDFYERARIPEWGGAGPRPRRTC
jgi:hypothetical protein